MKNKTETVIINGIQNKARGAYLAYQQNKIDPKKLL